MANSVLQNPQDTDWPLGFVQVPNAGTPVNLMFNVDPSNINAPGAATVPGSVTRAEYTPTCHRIWVQGFQPGNNGGWVPNVGNVYILHGAGPGNQNSGGPNNRSDSGVCVAIVQPGGFAQIPGMESDGPVISPYRYVLDVDNNNDGALVVLINCARG